MDLQYRPKKIFGTIYSKRIGMSVRISTFIMREKKKFKATLTINQYWEIPENLNICPSVI